MTDGTPNSFADCSKARLIEPDVADWTGVEEVAKPVSRITSASKAEQVPRARTWYMVGYLPPEGVMLSEKSWQPLPSFRVFHSREMENVPLCFQCTGPANRNSEMYLQGFFPPGSYPSLRMLRSKILVSSVIYVSRSV